MMTLEEFEDRLVTGIEKIESQFIYEAIGPHTLDIMKIKVSQLINNIGYEFGFTIDDKIIIRVEAIGGHVSIDFLNPNKPIYDIRYDGTRGEIIDYHKFSESTELYKALTGFPYDLYSPHR